MATTRLRSPSLDRTRTMNRVRNYPSLLVAAAASFASACDYQEVASHDPLQAEERAAATVVASLEGAIESGPLVLTSASASHTCRLEDGGMRCWGDNSHGQLGIGSGIPQGCTYSGAFFHADYCRQPVVPYGMDSGVVAMAVGGRHTCALKDDGRVSCWGSDYFGQLGHGDGMPSSCEMQGPVKICTLPNPVTGITSATSIAAGHEFTCAVLDDGSARCWGSDLRGQLGNGAALPAGCQDHEGSYYCSLPVTVNDLGPVAQIEAGFDHVCAVEDDGTLKCWGTNFLGALGIGQQVPPGCAPFGNESDYCTVPVTVGGVAAAASVSAGGYHTCALELGGTLKCWGSNFDIEAYFNGLGMIYGQLGVGSGIHAGCSNNWGPNDNIADRCSIPMVVSGATGTTQISAGSTNTCSRQANGEVRCWGSHNWGFAGVGDTLPPECIARGGNRYCPSPALVPSLKPVTHVTAGYGHSCAQQANGQVKCWGIDRLGQLAHLGTYPSWCHAGTSSTYCTAPVIANAFFGGVSL
jgi:alpha-tubulin suppressor-like RCC1 family protein